jgi:BON domain
MGKVHAQVRAGWVPLNGEVEWDYQRREVRRMVRNVRGVVGIPQHHRRHGGRVGTRHCQRGEPSRHQSRHPRPLVRQAAMGQRPERIRAALRR